MRIAAAIAGVLIAGQALGNEIPESLVPIVMDRDKIAESFAFRAAECLVKQGTDHVLFHGCIDWHSAAHASWALVMYANSGRAELASYPQISWLYEADGFSAFGEEMRFLDDNPAFENPYGRAWLLRLAIEADRSGANSAVGAATRKVFDELLAYSLEESRSPLSESYSSLSWALLNLYDYSVHFDLGEETEVLRARIVELYVKPADLSCDYAAELGGFMAVCTNWAMLAARVTSKDDYDVWLDAFIEQNGLPEPVISPKTSHEYGLNFSRAWGLWAMYDHSASPRMDIVDAYSAHFKAGYAQFVEVQGDYSVAGHWVAQFGLFALQPMLE